MSRSCFIVLNDEEQRLYSEGTLTLDYFIKEILPQMYRVLQYINLEKAYRFRLFTNIKRMIYDE